MSLRDGFGGSMGVQYIFREEMTALSRRMIFHVDDSIATDFSKGHSDFEI